MSSRDIIQAAAGVGGGAAVNPNAYDFYGYGAITPRTGSDWDVTTLVSASDARYDGGSLRTKAQSDLGAIIYNQQYAPVIFSSDGTKFLCQQRNGPLVSGTLSTAWDLKSTYTFNGYNSTFIAANITANYIWGFWTIDGINCYVTDNNYIMHFTLSTAWDAGSTYTLVNKKQNTTLDTQNSGAGSAWQANRQVTFSFADNGNVLYVANSVGMYAYNLISGGTAYDLDDYKYEGPTTGRYVSSSAFNNTPMLCCNGDGTKISIITSSSSAMSNGGSWYYEMTTAGDFSSITTEKGCAYAKYWFGCYQDTTNSQGGYGFTSFRGTSGTSAATGKNFLGVTINTSNNRWQEFVTAGHTHDYINEGGTTTPGNYSSYRHGFAFNDDGTKMFRIGYVRDVYGYNLSTAWEVNSAVWDNNYFTFLSQTTAPVGIEFNNDGTKMYATDQSGNVYQYSLSTAWDVSTATYDSKTLSVSGVSGIAYKFRWGDSGTKMFVASYANDNVRVFDLSTAYDISTASLSGSNILTANRSAGQPVAFVASSDGYYGYILDRLGFGVEQWSFSTPWDLTSGTFEGQKTFEDLSNTSYSDWSIGAYYNQIWGDIGIDATGERLYVSDMSTGKIFQITIDGS